MKDFRPGDVKISECLLLSKDGKREYDIRLQARHFDIYESLTEPLIFAEVIIADGIGLRRGFPLIGEETLKLSFNTPTMTEIELELSVYEVADIMQTDNNKTELYTLKLCSPELLTNASRLISKRYEGQISEIIKRIVQQDLASSKEVQVESTSGIDNHLVSQLAPLQVIDKFRHRAVSPQNKSSSYCFYEDRNGFHFVTLEGLIRVGKRTIADKVFFADDNIDIEIEQVRFRDILDWDQLVDQNSVEKVQAGALKNVVTKFDLLTGETNDITYTNEQYQDIFETTGDISKNSTARFKNQYGESPAQTFLVPFSSDNNDDFIGEKVGILHGFVEKIAQNMMHILIHGDSSIEVGSIIACNFSSTNALSKEKEVKVVSLNYLVSAVRHQITISDRPVYLQSLELMNSSYDY